MEFGSSTAKAMILLVIVTFLAILMSASQLEASTIVVGGSDQQWRYGINYTDWAIQNSPFYIGDNLVFRYEAPSKSSQAHTVYLLPNLWSYLTCDFKSGKLLANPVQGSGNGFAVPLNQWHPYYFASGEGSDCKDGMKFFAVPWPRWNF